VSVLEVSGLSCGYDAPLVSGLSLSLGPGQTLAVVGPNGAGKTTLLRTLCGELPALEGTVAVQGTDLGRLDHLQRARLVSILLQEDAGDGGLTVRELVELGRTPYLGLWGRPGAADREAVDRALEACRLGDLAHRRLDRISGGERQRTRIAMTVAQHTALLLLDEPANHLDLKRRFELFELLSTLRQERGLAAVIVLHDLAEAYREADRVLVLGGDGAVEVPASDPDRVAKLAQAFDVPEARIRSTLAPGA
jgi:ABC-type cobalamin/Fe3+-siderophores transport system ATPase subunit